MNRAAEITGFGGFIVRGDPSGVIRVGRRSGGASGVGGPTRRSLRAFAELHGEVSSDDQVTLSRSLVGTDGCIAPLVSDLENKTRLHRRRDLAGAQRPVPRHGRQLGPAGRQP